MADELSELQQWYASHCNGDWEHDQRIAIGNIDNPGWSLRINLEDTDLEGQMFATVKERYEHPTDWVLCCVADGQFQAAGGPFQLPRMLRIFLEWAAMVESSGGAPAG